MRRASGRAYGLPRAPGTVLTGKQSRRIEPSFIGRQTCSRNRCSQTIGSAQRPRRKLLRQEEGRAKRARGYPCDGAKLFTGIQSRRIACAPSAAERTRATAALETINQPEAPRRRVPERRTAWRLRAECPRRFSPASNPEGALGRPPRLYVRPQPLHRNDRAA